MPVTAADTRAHLASMASSRKRQLNAEQATLIQSLPEAVAALRSFGATRVVLFGSLAGGVFHERSDVDLAVAGLSWEQRDIAWSTVSAICQRDVDLIRIEAASAELLAAIAAHGIEL